MDVDRLLDGLNAEQRAAVTTEAAPLCIIAGAGSGKTRVLTRRIAHRVATGNAEPHRVLALTFMVPLLILGVGMNYTPPGGVLWGYVFLVLGGYFVWYWRRGGQTLAMQTWQLRVVTSAGGVVSVKQAWLRYALAWPSVWLAGIGLWWALLDPDRQFLHDRLAGTRIILLPPSPKN